jgi:hypothetical protein
VRRLLSISLLLLLSLPLISPLFALGAEADAGLPVCCRRDGKHHCDTMKQTLSDAGAARPAGQQAGVLHEKCPCYPVVLAAPHLDLSSDVSNSTTFAALITESACVAQTRTLRRISFDRSRQKRGPPSESA